MSETKQGRESDDSRLQDSNLISSAVIYPTSRSIKQHSLHGSAPSTPWSRGQAALQRLLHDNMATVVSIVSGSSISPCDPCRLGKLTRPHPAVVFDHNKTYALELVVIDLASQAQEPWRCIALPRHSRRVHSILLGVSSQSKI